MRRADGRPVEWRWAGAMPFADAVAAMRERQRLLGAGSGRELVLLFEPAAPVLTSGADAPAGAGLRVERGGGDALLGPGQIVSCVVLQLRERGGRFPAYLAALDTWLARVAWRCGAARVRHGHPGLWVREPQGERPAQLAAVGLSLRRKVTGFGWSFNVDSDLDAAAAIAPCGVEGAGITSLRALGRPHAIDAVAAMFRQEFVPLFGPVSGD